MLALCRLPVLPVLWGWGSLLLVCAQSEPKTFEARLGTPFDLALHQSARIDSADLQLRFVEIVEDSRCPGDVDCIWEGRAVIRLQCELAGESTTFELILRAGHSHLARTERGSFVIALRSLTPYPEANEETSLRETVATLLVTDMRREGADPGVDGRGL